MASDIVPVYNDDLHLYPSGFLGRSLPGPDPRPSVQEPDPSATFNSFRVEDKPKQIRRYNTRIEQLFEKYQAGTRSLSSFAFRQEFFEAAFESFHGALIGDWILRQPSSPEFTQLHAGFLEDTVCFITKGRRKTSVTLYRDLFARQRQTQLEHDRIGLTATTLSELSYLRTFDSSGDQARWPEVFARWVGRDGGLDDFVMTLGLLFGKPW